jgi:hypothetical protein
MPIYAIGYTTSCRKAEQLGAALICDARTEKEFNVKSIGGLPTIASRTQGYAEWIHVNDTLFFTQQLSLVQ